MGLFWAEGSGYLARAVAGPDHLRLWRDHRRDVFADFRRAFGEDPGPLVAIAVMTDSDNTRSRAETWYGPVTLSERATTAP